MIVLNPKTKQFVTFALTIILILASMFFAVVVKPPESAIVVAILFVLLMAVIAADLVLSTRLIKRFNNTKLVKRREILEETWDKAGIDIKAMEKRIKRYLNTCRLLHVLFVLLCMASIYCSVIFLDTDIFVLMIMIRILFLLSSFALWGLVSLFVFKNKQELPKYELSPKEYPILFQIAKEAAQLAGAGGNIRIFAGEHNICVFRHGRYDCIQIGEIIGNLLTKEEMKQVLVHEFAHVYNNHTRLMNKLGNTAYNFYLHEEEDMTCLPPMRTVAFLFNREYYYYSICTRQVQEAEADNIVKKVGDRQSFVNAIAKSAAFSLFCELPCPHLSIHVFESEKPIDNYGEVYLDIYLKYLEKNENLYRKILDNELPGFLRTHPIFRERKTFMEVEDFDFHTIETDEEYKKEQKKLLGILSKAFDELDNYSEIRHEYYVKRFGAIKNYEENANQEVHTLLETALYFEGVDNEKAKKILKTVLEKDDDNSNALFSLGRILLYEFDKRGIEYIYKAIRLNEKLAQPGLQLTGRFCEMTGLEEELEEHRSKFLELGQEAMDKMEVMSGISGKDTLLPHDLDKDTLDKIVQFITDTADGKLGSLLLFKKVAGELQSHVFVLVFPPNIKKKDLDDICIKVHNYLDLRIEHFILLRMFQTDNVRWIYRKVKNCEVWSRKKKKVTKNIVKILTCFWVFGIV